MKIESEQKGGDYSPKFVADLNCITPQRFNELLEEFEKWAASLGEPPPLKLKNGWYTCDQRQAEQWLLRNRKGANRHPALGTVIYYSDQQADNKWPRTGQPIIFNVQGVLLDGQHRLWACYLGNTRFDTYVVADTPEFPDIFAYVDNVKVRTASTALATGGFNGLSPLINQTVQIVQSFDAGVYSATSKGRLPRMAPIAVLNYVREHPTLRQAARLAAGEYKAASEFIGHKDVVAFVVYKVVALFDESVVDEFFEEVGDVGGSFSEGSPVVALHKVIEADHKSQKPMTKHLILAHVIKAFNAWKLGTAIKKLSFRVNENFPAFVTGEEDSHEEEAA